MRVPKGWRMAGKATWKKFIEENPQLSISYVDFQNIIYGFNEGFRDYILETGERIKYPFGFGTFVIAKSKTKKFKKGKEGKQFIALPVDWKKTKELGFKVYHYNSHTEGFKFHYKRMRASCRFFLSNIWSFKPSRVSSRLLNFKLKQDPDHQHKYHEWESIRYK